MKLWHYVEKTILELDFNITDNRYFKVSSYLCSLLNQRDCIFESKQKLNIMKKALTLLAAVFAFALSGAQTVPTRWYNTFGTTNANGNNASDQARNSYSWRLEFPRLYQGSNLNYDVTHTSSSFPDPQNVNYSLEWDGVKQGNRWTVYQLTKTNLTKKVTRQDNYDSDPDVPSNVQPSTKFTSGSGYNRGHLCPSADRLYSREVNNQVMYITNIMPENPSHNSGTWGDLEQTVRGWLTNGKMDTLYVVKAGTIDDKHLIGYIGSNKYPIPQYMYMAFLGYNKSSETFHAMAAMSENTSSGTTSYVTIDSLENLTGIDFFCNLPDEIENSLEADASSANAKYWGVSSIIAAEGTNTNVDPTPNPDTPSTDEGSGTETDPYTVQGLLDNWATGKTVTVTGYVTKVEDFNSKYGELTYYIADEKGGTTTFYIYNGYGLNGAKFTSTSDLEVGWKVTVTGTTKEYNGTKEFNYGSKIISIDKGGSSDNPDTPTAGDGTENNPYSVAEAEAILTAGTQSASAVYVKGIISKISEVSTSYGNATYYISDDGTTSDQFYVFRGKYLSNAKFTSEDQIQVGDKVVIYGVLTNYSKSGTTIQEVTSSQITKLAVPVTISASEYSTLYWSNRAFTVPEGVTAYTYTVSGGKLTRTDVGKTIPADEAVVLNGKEGTYYFYVTTATGTKASANDLYGTDAESAITNDDNYYFYEVSYDKNGENVGFYWANETGSAFTNGAHKAYLKVLKTNANGAKGWSFDGETTGIDTVQSTIRTPQFAKIYNLNGQRVSESYRGVVIVNGKKYVK